MKKIFKKISTPVTLLMVLLTIAVQGAYAADQPSLPDVPEMDFSEMKNMSLEMMEMNIESLSSMQSGGDYEELDDLISSLIEHMETLKSEIESAEDEDDLNGIMEEFRTLMDGAPEEIREKLMANGGMSGPGNGNFSMDNNTMREPGEHGNFPEGNGTMKEGNFSGEKPAGERPGNDASGEENNGLLSGLINRIKAIFS